mgnify:CR=1 FL=1
MFAPIIDAFALPSATLVDRRVPKTLLIENGAPTAADKRLIRDGIEELRWVAALKPNLVGIAAWTSPQGSYAEIAVLTATFREQARVPRLVGLIHRAIPYPLVLLTLSDRSLGLSLAHKRPSQSDSGKTVLDGEIHATPPLDPASSALVPAFTGSLALHQQNAADLRQLYQAWIDHVIALRAAGVTGCYRSLDEPGGSSRVRDSLDRHDQLARDIQALRKRAAKERQLNRRVDLNLQIKSLELELEAIKSTL